MNNKPQVKPDNYLAWAIVTTLCCCMPFGVVAIVNAAGVDSAWSRGDYDEALLKSQNAAKWCKLSAVVGGIVIFLYIVILAICVAAGALSY